MVVMVNPSKHKTKKTTTNKQFDLIIIIKVELFYDQERKERNKIKSLIDFDYFQIDQTENERKFVVPKWFQQQQHSNKQEIFKLEEKKAKQKHYITSSTSNE